MHKVCCTKKSLYIFLSGGAGVEKSVVLRALYQALLNYYNHCLEKNLTFSKFYFVLQQEKLLITLEKTQYTTPLAIQLVGNLNLKLRYAAIGHNEV